MPKGYWIPHIDVRDPQGYQRYMAATPQAHRKYNGVALVRGGRMEVMEGHARARVVLREFPDYATALACYRSPEYQAARPLRLAHSEADFVIVEGCDDEQRPTSETPPVPAVRKGYWIAHVDVTDPVGYQAYAAADQGFGTFGARFLVRAGTQEAVEGHLRSRTVVLEFPSFAAALDCYRSPAYQAAKRLRDGKVEADLMVVEGYDGPAH